MKTFSLTPADIRREWHLIDATGKTLGRLATEVASRLRGKHKAEFTPHMDNGDYIIVVNARNIHVTGRKSKDKSYHRYSGYPGGLHTTSFEKLRDKHPEKVIETAVKGMLPKGPLGREMFRKLRVYAGGEHQHSAQQPKPLEI